jgi:hypothetical protein
VNSEVLNRKRLEPRSPNEFWASVRPFLMLFKEHMTAAVGLLKICMSVGLYI